MLIAVIKTRTPMPDKKEMPTAANMRYIPIPMSRGRVTTPPKACPKK